MALIPGGEFWMGSTEGADDERPRYKTRLADFCMDQTEVTTSAYRACIDAKQCSVPHGYWTTCNFSHRDRGQHPINCVDALQAESFCTAHGAELPTEAEWEYAARGGSELRRFPWGDASPDDHACWKRAHSCPVKTYPSAAFGLYDMAGNVWEWTADGYGAYPWVPPEGGIRVYRGGGWSRRFEKWMSPTLRNWFSPGKWGSHLGFRCAKLALGAECPFGATTEGRCKHGVIEVECAEGTKFNGARCVGEGDPECPSGMTKHEGYGCLREIPAVAASPAAEARSVQKVRRSRTPSFDRDCRAYQKERPQAYRFEGGTHRARNEVEAALGCKNRDVGVAWNSACCPQSLR